MGLVKCVRHAEKKEREMLVQKKKKKKANLSTHSTCFKSVPHFRQSVGTRPVESNPVFIRTPPTPSSSVSHFQFHLLVPLCDFHLISLLKFKIYSRFFQLDSRCCREALFMFQIWNCKSRVCDLGGMGVQNSPASPFMILQV